MSIFDEGNDEGIFGLGSLGIPKEESGTTVTPGGAKGAPAAGGGTTATGHLATAGGIVGGSVNTAQRTLQAAGFNLGSTGVDGTWGPCTAAALRAYLAQHGEQAAVHTFGSTLVGRARSTTGTCSARQPASGTSAAAAAAAATAAATAEELAPEEASILSIPGIPGIPGLPSGGGAFYMQWWFWLAIASAAGLSYFGYKYYKEKKAEEEMDIAAGGF